MRCDLLKVGEVVYVKAQAQKTNVLIPVKVLEKIVRQRVDDTSVQYVVQGPDKKSYDIDPKNDEIFLNGDEARRSLMADAARKVDLMIQKADRLRASVFPVDLPDVPEETLDDDNGDNEELIAS